MITGGVSFCGVVNEIWRVEGWEKGENGVRKERAGKVVRELVASTLQAFAPFTRAWKGGVC